MGYHTAESIKEALLFGSTWMELETIMLSEISQLSKTNTYDLIYN